MRIYLYSHSANKVTFFCHVYYLAYLINRVLQKMKKTILSLAITSISTSSLAAVDFETNKRIEYATNTAIAAQIKTLENDKRISGVKNNVDHVGGIALKNKKAIASVVSQVHDQNQQQDLRIHANLKATSSNRQSLIDLSKTAVSAHKRSDRAINLASEAIIKADNNNIIATTADSKANESLYKANRNTEINTNQQKQIDATNTKLNKVGEYVYKNYVKKDEVIKSVDFKVNSKHDAKQYLEIGDNRLAAANNKTKLKKHDQRITKLESYHNDSMAELRSTAFTIDTKVQAHNTEIQNIAVSSTRNTTDVSKLKNDLNELSKGVTTNYVDIQENTATINKNTTAIAKIHSQVTDNSEDLDQMSHALVGDKQTDEQIQTKLAKLSKGNIVDSVNNNHNLINQHSAYHVQKNQTQDKAIAKNSADIADLRSDFERQATQTNQAFAAIAAMNNIPLVTGTDFSMGAGVGYYNSESAVSVGGNYNVTENVTIKASIAGNANNWQPIVGAGVAVGW